MNKGKKVNVQQYITRREEIKVRLNEIVDLAESENKRAFTDTENDEIECLKREMNALDVRIPQNAPFLPFSGSSLMTGACHHL